MSDIQKYSSPISNSEKLKSLIQFSELMAQAVVTIPKHLQGKPGDCLAIAMQADRWEMDPFVVAQKTHLVNGNLGYEAQLVNAVVASSGAIKGRFHYEYKMEGQSVACRVGAVPSGESEVLWGQWLSEKEVSTKNSPLWKTNPRQQLGYLQVKNWARQYAPAAILGVYTSDELQDIQQPNEINMGSAEIVEAQTEEKPIYQIESVVSAVKASMTLDGLKSIWDSEIAKIKQLNDTDAYAVLKTSVSERKSVLEQCESIYQKIDQAQNVETLELALILSQDLSDESLKEVIYERYTKKFDQISGGANEPDQV